MQMIYYWSDFSKGPKKWLIQKPWTQREQWPPYTQINPSLVICGLSYTTHLHLTSREARAQGAKCRGPFFLPAADQE